MKILYALFKLVAWKISLLPFPILYCLSDVVYFFLYHVFGYRKNVVFKNLKNAFPEKNIRERKKIAGKFYHNLADIILEVIKTRNISREEIMKRVQFDNLDLVEEMYRRKKSVIGMIGHCGNWEWMPPMLQQHIGFRGYAIVKPLSDEFFEQYINRLRSRFIEDGQLVPFKLTLRNLLKHRDELNFTMIAADQTPHKNEINYWTNFLNQETPFFLGTEKIAKSLDLAVLYLDVQRVKRGHYLVRINKITDTPKETGEFWITNQYVRMLEDSIREHPDNWLWSHRRWKYQRESTGE